MTLMHFNIFILAVKSLRYFLKIIFNVYKYVVYLENTADFSSLNTDAFKQTLNTLSLFHFQCPDKNKSVIRIFRLCMQIWLTNHIKAV